MIKLLVVGASTLVASALSSACSSANPVFEMTTEPQVGHTAPPDGGPAADGGPGVWLANSTGFELTETGNGPPFLPAAGSACSDLTTRWKYDVTSRELSETGCDDVTFKPTDETVVLTPASAADLVAQISSLTSEPSAPASACGYDGDEQTLTVTNPSGTSSYKSDWNANCANGAGVAGPFVSWSALQTFTGDVFDYFSACRSTDGSPPDSSRATCLTSIAYPIVDGGAPVGSPATQTPDASDGG